MSITFAKFYIEYIAIKVLVGLFHQKWIAKSENFQNESRYFSFFQRISNLSILHMYNSVASRSLFNCSTDT